jgi:phage FluMu protein Com
MPVCRTCNAEFEKALTLKVGQTVKVVCPNCKDDNVHDSFPTPEESRAQYRSIIDMIHRIDDYKDE